MANVIGYTFGDDSNVVSQETAYARWSDSRTSRWLTTSQAWKFVGKDGLEGDCLVVLTKDYYERPTNYCVLRIGKAVHFVEGASFQQALKNHGLNLLIARGGYEMDSTCQKFTHPSVAWAMKSEIRKAVKEGPRTLKKTEKRFESLCEWAANIVDHGEGSFTFSGVTLEGKWEITLKP